jgi:hypothetical protein
MTLALFALILTADLAIQWLFIAADALADDRELL